MIDTTFSTEMKALHYLKHQQHLTGYKFSSLASMLLVDQAISSKDNFINASCFESIMETNISQIESPD
jgi:hypothetical protein